MSRHSFGTSRRCNKSSISNTTPTLHWLRGFQLTLCDWLIYAMLEKALEAEKGTCNMVQDIFIYFCKHFTMFAIPSCKAGRELAALFDLMTTTDIRKDTYGSSSSLVRSLASNMVTAKHMSTHEFQIATVQHCMDRSSAGRTLVETVLLDLDGKRITT